MELEKDNNNQLSVSRNSEEKRCTLVGMTSDITLSALKITTGIVGHSSAILADGIHSISDTVTDALVYAMVRLSGKGPDERYRYGRGKYETLAAFLISLILVVVALGLMHEGAQDVWAAVQGATLERPHNIALIVGIIAVIVKEGLYHYTRLKGRKPTVRPSKPMPGITVPMRCPLPRRCWVWRERCSWVNTGACSTR